MTYKENIVKAIVATHQLFHALQEDDSKEPFYADDIKGKIELYIDFYIKLPKASDEDFYNYVYIVENRVKSKSYNELSESDKDYYSALNTFHKTIMETYNALEPDKKKVPFEEGGDVKGIQLSTYPLIEWANRIGRGRMSARLWNGIQFNRKMHRKITSEITKEDILKFRNCGLLTWNDFKNLRDKFDAKDAD